MSWWERLVDKARGVFGSSSASQKAGACCHPEIQLRQGTAEFEEFVARGELEHNHNLPHGATHLANLLSYDPGRPEWVELLENYLGAAQPDPEALIPRGEQLYYTTEAMRAYIWHKQGKLREAVGLLVNVVQAKQEARYLEAWALDWLQPPGAVESLPENEGLHLFALILNRFPEVRRSTLPRLESMRRWGDLIERFAKQFPGAGPTTMLRAGILRKAGRFEEALVLVKEALNESPDWHTATALGLIYREKGEPQAAEGAFRLALQLDPSDISARLEAGDTFFERDDWQSALRWYEDALSKDANQPWAKASAMYCRWVLTDDAAHGKALVDLAHRDPSNQRAVGLCQHAFHYGLPLPVDATANLLRQFRERIVSDRASAPKGEAKLTLSSLEAPSNFLAFRLEMEAQQHDLTLAVTVESVPRPDPRQPAEEVKYCLWTYEGTDPSPGLPPPGTDVAARIGELAAARYDWQTNWAAASRAAKDLGSARVAEILATMVHPPPLLSGRQALAWLPRVQLAAAQVAGQLDDGPVRREALMSVLLGPTDWATEAAIRVLGYLAAEQEAIAPDIHAAFERLSKRLPDSGYCCWERTLFEQWQYLPHLFPQEREMFEKRLQEIDNRHQTE